jgi:energy-coupling factor transporter ATP-binding protein EcfA2
VWCTKDAARGGHADSVTLFSFALKKIMEINLSIENYRCFPTGSPARLKLIKGFSAFVGVNNSGKSSLLKFFYEMRPVFTQVGNPNVIQQLFNGAPQPLQTPPEILDRDEMFFNGNRDNIQIEVRLDGLPRTPGAIYKAVAQIARPGNLFTVKFFLENLPELSLDNMRSLHGEVRWAEAGKLKKALSGEIVATFEFIQSACRLLAGTYYIPAFRHASPLTPAEGAAQSYYDINVGRPLIEMWHGLQAGTSKSGREEIYRLINEIKNNFGFKELQISAALDRNSLQLIIDGRPFALQELGAGLAQFIVVLGNAAFRKPSFILIDEPEISLHPSLQLKFLMKLSAYASEGVVFATHNIGLARAVAEEIYSIMAGPEGSTITKIEATPRLAELLGELNYEGYRPLGFNKVMLIEGRTGVKTLFEFLRLFNKDQQFLVVPMSDMIHGNSHDELQEVTRICPQTFAIIDSERKTEGDQIEPRREAFADTCRALQIDCLTLERRAIENYLSDRAIKLAQGSAYRALTPYEGRQGLNLWPKTENWKIARAMERAEIEATDLGQFLARV